MRVRLPVIAALSLAAGIASAQLGRPQPSPAVYPRQTLPLSFSHLEHARRGLDCVPCHADVLESTRAADRLLPGEAACTGCHAIDRNAPDGKCAVCHPGWNGAGEPPRAVIPTPNLKFSHKVHASRNIACAACHGDLVGEGVGLATREQLPRMATCLGCHDGKRAQSACTACHISTPKGLVQTDLREGKLVPADHDLRFRRDHAAAARNDARTCASCHEQRWCLDCHDGVVKPFDLHGNDYIRLHTIDARRNVPDCKGCHRLQTFCTGCHARSGVSDDPRTGEFKRSGDADRFHPQGWTGTDPRHAADHSYQAQRNLRACASCHREDFCVGCHRTVSPHPPGFAGTARCRALASRTSRTCLRCHARLEDARCD